MQLATVDPADQAPACEFPLAWAAKLIERLHMTYGSKFLQQWEGIDTAKLAQFWAGELADFTGEEIAAGLAACRTRPWPPTLPEFIGLCRPWMDPETAFREAVLGMAERAGGGVGTWSHPAVYWAAVRVGHHDLMSNGWQAIRGRWEAALRDVLAQQHWHPVPTPKPSLAAPGRGSASREEQDQFLGAMKDIAGTPSSAPRGEKRDPKDWARKILANPKGRTLAIVEMARRALDVEEPKP